MRILSTLFILYNFAVVNFRSRALISCHARGLYFGGVLVQGGWVCQRGDNLTVTIFLLQLEHILYPYIYASFFFCIMDLHLILSFYPETKESYALDFYFSVNLLHLEVHQLLFFFFFG